MDPRPAAVRPPLHWRWLNWRNIDADSLYGLLKLRSDVFVVEQNCVFSEMDGLDPQCEHLVASAAGEGVVACLRLVPAGTRFAEPSLGRVVVAAHWRGGTGRQLMQRGIAACTERFPQLGIGLSAQQHLEDFYRSLGFVTQGAVYLEDGIAHVDMRRPPAPPTLLPAGALH